MYLSIYVPGRKECNSPQDISCEYKELLLTLKSPSGEGNGNPLQYSCLENPMDRGTCQATVYGVTESDTTE